jgi:hypothetical protein
MKTENVLLVLAAIAVIVSGVGAIFTYYSIASSSLTGYVTATGTVNITILSQAMINFSVNNINWSTGMVTNAPGNATLVTTGANNTGGNWTNITQGFIIENIGNVNVSINLTADQNATQFIGGTNPLYQLNITNNEPGSCNNASNFNISLGQWYNVTTLSTWGIFACSNLSFGDTNDTIRVDVKLVVPSDSKTGALGSIVTATALPPA